MRLLFELDRRDYADCGHVFKRDSARAIIIRGGKIAMIRSGKFDYYKFPGGGIEAGEDPAQAMMRETLEEAGLIVRPETVREYGYVHRAQRSTSDPDEAFLQDNYYYLCEAEEKTVSQTLDAYEAEEGYTLEFIDPLRAVTKNREAQERMTNRLMLEREARVIELLMREGYLV